MRERTIRGVGVALVMVIAAGLVGCGDDGSAEAPTTTTTADGDATTTVAPTTTTTAPSEVVTTTIVAGNAALTDPVVERGEDGTLAISWTAADPTTPVVVSWATDPEAAGTELVTVEGETTATVDDPAPGGRAYFRLVAGDTETVVAERRVALEGVPNFRDLGGYETHDGRHVRWGRLFRSGALVDLTDDDLAVVDTLGISLVCDLRSDAEVSDEPDPDIGAEALRLAVTDEAVDVAAITDAILAGDLDQLSPDLLLDGMPSIAVDFPEAWGNLVARISDEASLPTNLHCTAGKDRAGWASALVLRALGVPEETVMEDYLLSNDYLAESNAETIAQVRTIVAGVQGVPEDEVDMSNLVALLEVRSEYLQAAFDAVEAEYGTFDTYLAENLGLSENQITTLRDTLLE